MKVQFGNSVKNIPKQYYDGTWLIDENDLEAHGKIRLTPWERFIFAEASYRTKCSALIRDHLSQLSPIYASKQINRHKDVRYVVQYDNGDGLGAIAIVSKGVYNACPDEFQQSQNVDW